MYAVRQVPEYKSGVHQIGSYHLHSLLRNAQVTITAILLDSILSLRSRDVGVS